MVTRFRNFFSILTCIILTISFIAGCGAYFNTFYNAKKFFNAAERKRLDQEKKALVSGTATAAQNKKSNIQEYEKAIEKGSRVLQLHPNSKYVDDALMIIGQSFYHTGEYIKARRKFEELNTYLPNSDYVPQSKLWLGKCLIEMNEYDEALKVLNELVTEETNRKLAAEARLLSGELYFARGDYSSAIKEFTNIIDRIGDKPKKIRAFRRIGDAYLELKEYDDAARTFRQALDQNPDLEQRYLVELSYGQTLRVLQDYDQALLVFDAMTKGALTRNEMAHVRMEIARTFVKMEEWEKAEITLTDIAADYSKSDNAVRAYFELGKIYMQKKGDFQKAKELFEAAQKEFNRSSIRDSLKFWLDSTSEWDKLNFERVVFERAYYYYDHTKSDTVGDYLVSESDIFGKDLTDPEPFAEKSDTTSAADSLKAKAADDSTFLAQNLFENLEKKDEEKQEINPSSQQKQQSETNQGGKVEKKVKKVSVPKNFVKLEKRLIDTRKQLAELFLFQLELPDSALSHYEYLYQSFSQNEQNPHWMFLCSALHESAGQQDIADSMLKTLVDKYPDTRYAREARAKLGMQLQIEAETADEAETLFTLAEILLFRQNDADSSRQVYKKVIAEHSESEYAAKALFVLAWIAEWKHSNNQEAKDYYEKVQKQFPDSDYGLKAKRKLDDLAIAEKKEAERQAELQLAQESAQPDSIDAGKPKLSPKELEAMDIFDRGTLDSLRQKQPIAKKDTSDTKPDDDPRKRAKTKEKDKGKIKPDPGNPPEPHL